MLQLPLDTLRVIFNYLDYNDKYFLRLSCKQWNAVVPISNNQKIRFSDAQFYHAKNGHLSVILWLKNHGRLDHNIINGAAFGGQIAILEWAHRNNLSYADNGNYWACNSAALNGHIRTLEWLHLHGYPWHAETCANAAKNGHLDALQYLRNNNCPWDWQTTTFAAGNGHMNVLKWAIKNKCDIDNCRIQCYAAASGSLSMITFLLGNGCLLNPQMYNYAGEKGNIEIMEWLHSNGVQLSTYDSCTKAAAAGQLEVLKWLVKHKGTVIWGADTASAAAENGQIEVLKFLKENDCHYLKVALRKAVRIGRLDSIKWLHENGIQWDSDATTNAICSGNLECVKYVLENGSIWSVKWRQIKPSNVLPEIMDWLQEHKYPMPQIESIEIATEQVTTMWDYFVKIFRFK